MRFTHRFLIGAAALVIIAAAGASAVGVFGEDSPTPEQAAIEDVRQQTTEVLNGVNVPPQVSEAIQEALNTVSTAIEEAKQTAPVSTPPAGATPPAPQELLQQTLNEVEKAVTGSTASSAIGALLSENATVNINPQELAGALSGGANGVAVDFAMNCPTAQSCETNMVITLSGNGQGITFSTSSSGSGTTVNASSVTTTAATGCTAVPPALKTEYKPDGSRSITYQYSSGC